MWLINQLHLIDMLRMNKATIPAQYFRVFWARRNSNVSSYQRTILSLLSCVGFICASVSKAVISLTNTICYSGHTFIEGNGMSQSSVNYFITMPRKKRGVSICVHVTVYWPSLPFICQQEGVVCTHFLQHTETNVKK
jgi:hypothetical protein